MPEPLQLAVEAEGMQETGVRLLHQPFALIGRDQRADVPLDHRLVSRRHVYLQVVEGHVFWVDLESRLGTLGSGRPRKFGWLDVDETMRIGPYEIRRLVGGRPLHHDAAHHPLPDAVPLVAKSYGPSPWPEVALEFLNGPSRSAVWPMNRVMSLVGSASGCKFRLADPSVSPFHCSLLRTSVGLWLIDLLGSDGVAVNNASVRYALLADGDLLKIGRYRIRVRSRFFDDESRSDHPGATTASPQRPSSHVLSLREPSAAHAAPADAVEFPAPGRPSWSSSTAISPLSFGPQIARAELVPTAGAGAAWAAGSEKVEVEAAVLVPLMNQFGMMQQQMLDQFQNAMGMLVEMFGSLQREQMDLIRQELDQLREVTREFQEVKLELAAYTRDRAQAEASAAEAAVAAAVPSPLTAKAKPPVPQPQEVRTPAPTASPSPGPSAAASLASAASPLDASPAAATSAMTSPAGIPKKRPGEGSGADNERDVMLWLNQRVVTLQNERETRWQKILKLLPGAS
ncbi:MAG: FHA domain-containing protein [Paludisphaera borealis]|uniref:FHA domain-containing protein n=1 Tax=Paludisphaera borealis TaxID=1387353 RepID=UPI00283C4692|nr:FHA domain-containing protein [Paludisphaera borealis]MDR3622642.1 FHA domain-containing protein [Paludisphaera borealis]